MPEINLVGDADDLPNLIVMADVMNQLLGQTPMGGQEKELAPKRSGKILIRLCFSGVTSKKIKKTQIITFRLMNPKDSPKSITLERIKAYSNLIVKKFDNWQHIKGKESYCYADWDKGYQLQLLTVNQNEAKKIVEQVLDIQGHSPEWEYLSLTKNSNEVKRYPEKPNKVIVAGKSIRPQTQRPICPVKFVSAQIRFPHVTQYFALCNKRQNLITNLNFLNAYTD